MNDIAWDALLTSINQAACIPFLGAGASYQFLPLAAATAEAWATEADYPFSDRQDLARVAQYLSIEGGGMHPKRKLLDEWHDKFSRPDYQPPDFSLKTSIHGVLARLPLKVYMTTNYDNFMGEALGKSARLSGEKPRLMICPWNRLVRQKLRHADQFLSNAALKQAEPTVQQPTIFHLHGHMDLPESLVLTEDDYLEFLVELTRDRKLIPLQVREAIAESSLLFVGYRLSDWTFRVIFRSISNLLPFNVRGKHISVQLEPPKDTTLPPEKRDALQEKTKEYLRKSLQLQDVEVFWISADEFASELNRRWDQKMAPAPQVEAGSGSTAS